MKAKLKALMRWAITFVVCFIVVYLIVFFGGWKLFESGDAVLVELGVALVLSIFVYLFAEIVIRLEKRVKALEERLEKIENTQ